MSSFESLLSSGDDAAHPVHERTIAVLAQRRRSHLIRRRGWFVRRALLVADLVGLAVAFLVTERVFGTGSGWLANQRTRPFLVVSLERVPIHDSRTDDS